ncbi:MAG: hemerythrin family protein [Rhodospirillaceae bacterium]
MPIERSESQTGELLSCILADVRSLMESGCVNSVSDVGDHHRRLLERFEDFVGAVLDGHLVSEAVDIMARDFTDFLGNHFSVEETIMSLLEYRGEEAHKQQHRRFLDEVRHLLRMLPLGVGTYGDFALMVGDWLLKHEGTLDAELAEHAAAVIAGKTQLAVE